MKPVRPIEAKFHPGDRVFIAGMPSRGALTVVCVKPTPEMWWCELRDEDGLTWHMPESDCSEAGVLA